VSVAHPPLRHALERKERGAPLLTNGVAELSFRRSCLSTYQRQARSLRRGAHGVPVVLPTLIVRPPNAAAAHKDVDHPTSRWGASREGSRRTIRCWNTHSATGRWCRPQRRRSYQRAAMWLQATTSDTRRERSSLPTRCCYTPSARGRRRCRVQRRRLRHYPVTSPRVSR
jgi:hypothetical protein